MQNYLELCREILENGTRQANRTGIDAISLPGAMLKFNLQAGFPLMTTKKMAVKGMVGELCAFLEGATSASRFRELGCMFWDQNANENKAWLSNPNRQGTDDLGRIYGFLWRNYPVEPRTIVQIRRKICEDCVDAPKEKPTVAGVGYRGGYKIVTELDKKLHNIWKHLLNRCYSPTNPAYKDYGAKGVTVSERWHNFATFRKDVEKLPQWLFKKENLEGYELDKDYFGSNVYGLTTCVWLSKEDNVTYRYSRPFKVTTPDRQLDIGINLHHVAEKYNLQATHICKVLKGGLTHHKGFTFSDIENTDPNVLYRYQLALDQVKEAIWKIRNTPTDRRIRISAWRPDQFAKMALPPCHTEYQFIVNVEKRELNLCMYQRSCDMFLGVPMNIASASLFLSIMAHLTGYKPGTFTHFLADAHIYVNHIDQVKEQMVRMPLPLPRLIISPELVDIDNVKPEHFTFEDYQCYSAIKAEMAV